MPTFSLASFKQIYFKNKLKFLELTFLSLFLAFLPSLEAPKNIFLASYLIVALYRQSQLPPSKWTIWDWVFLSLIVSSFLSALFPFMAGGSEWKGFRGMLIELRRINFYIGNPISNSSVICRSEIIKKFYFNESKELIAVEDFDLWIKILLSNADMIKISFPLLFYRRSVNQISRNKFKMAKKNLLVYIKNFGRFKGFFFHIFYISFSLLKLINQKVLNNS